ncbi:MULTISPECIES: DsbA family oxidoreductase [unclassified Streptomyces]|uniref:DsbA family oxidoreductase n=1 Tax=unclassified Streptomyces TaxID=2593676 RepID=UPI0022B6DFA0|nr:MULTISPECIES: DsbA family protein [unclassified Streptomyces]MCZ7416819.1 DsbA family protein [Streptomyces sp. WMMC897]MCZ7433371.1 DsbA family protein [Streptomyces sp. WMMC1477]
MVIRIWFNYVSPFSMLTRRLLGSALADPAVEVRWLPHEGGGQRLGAPPPSALVWEFGVRRLAWRLGLEIGRSAPPPTGGRLALRGYQYACDQGLGEEYSEHVYAAYFLEKHDIGQLGPLVRVAGLAGLEPEAFRRAVTSQHYAQRHRAALREGRNVTVVPTLACGGHRIEGVPTVAQIERLTAGAAPLRA